MMRTDSPRKSKPAPSHGPWRGENVFTYIDGSATGPTYPGGQYSAFGIGAPRERRAQFQDRGAISLRCDFGPFFIRPTASLLYYDLQTALVNTPGYLNFPDRYDVNGARISVTSSAPASPPSWAIGMAIRPATTQLLALQFAERLRSAPRGFRRQTVALARSEISLWPRFPLLCAGLGHAHHAGQR